MKTKYLGLIACALLGTIVEGGAYVIDFETPYTLGTFATAQQNPAAFTAQQGWSQSINSAGLGNIQTTTSSGSYVGGQALSGGASGYIGAFAGVVPQGNTYSYDLMMTANEKAALGRWNDVNTDGLAAPTELGATVGVTTGGFFTIRAASLGADNSTGIPVVFSTWYRVTSTYNDALLTVTMDVFDLTNNLTVDLNGATAGTSFSVIFSAANYGATAAEADGIFARMTFNTMFVDNITYVPEPSTYALLGLGILLIGYARRKRLAKASVTV